MIFGLWLDTSDHMWFDAGMTKTSTNTTNPHPYRVEIEGRRYRARSMPGAARSIGRNIKPGEMATVTYWDEPVMHAVGTSLGWMTVQADA